MPATPPPHARTRPALHWLPPVLLALIAMVMLARWLPVWLGRDLASEARLLAALLPGLLILLPPALHQARPVVPILAVAGLSGLLALPALGPVVVAAPGPALAAAATVALLTALVGMAAGLARPAARPAWHGLLLLGLVVAALAPVWLAALLDRLAAWPGAIDTLVALNPLTWLGGPWGRDLPRADWFYRHSPLGSLRYTLPSPPALLGVGALLAGLGAWRLARRTQTRSMGPPEARLSHHTED